MSTETLAFYDVDVGAILRFRCRLAGRVFNLTDCTVVLLCEGLDTVDVTITDAVNGLAEYVVQPNDFPTGEYAAHLRVEIDSATKLHSEQFRIRSRALYSV